MVFTEDADCLPDRISVPDAAVSVKTAAAHKTSVFAVNEASHNKQIITYNLKMLKMLMKKINAMKIYDSVKLETTNNTKRANAVIPIEAILLEEKEKVQSKNTTLEDYSSDGSLNYNQLQVLKSLNYWN